MRLKYLTKKFVNNARGDMPVTVFIWYIILSFTCITVIGIIMYWYYVLYITAYGTSVTVVGNGKHASIIDAKQLRGVLIKRGIE